MTPDHQSPEVAATPSFIGQFSIEQEYLARVAIWGQLQKYAHGTGALAGDDVVKWFLEQSERAWTAAERRR